MKITQIYALIDPITNKLRYIGGTTQDLKHRLYQHITYAMTKKKQTHLSCWIRSLLDKSLKPTIQTFLVCKGNTFYEEEIECIAICKDLGCDLTNSTIGGEYNVGEPKTLTHRERLSAALKGKPKSPEHRAALSAARMGYRHTKESKEKLSKSLKGRKFSEKSIQQIINTRRSNGKPWHTDKTKENIAKGVENYYASK